MYVLGGIGNDILDHCEKYSVDKDEWTILAPMTKEKLLVSACILNDQYIFSIGGFGYNFKSLNDIERYSIADNKWEVIKIIGDQELSPRNSSFSFQVNLNEILIGGGSDDDLIELQDCYTFDTCKNTMNKVGDLPNGDRFSSPSCLNLNNKIYMVGD